MYWTARRQSLLWRSNRGRGQDHLGGAAERGAKRRAGSMVPAQERMALGQPQSRRYRLSIRNRARSRSHRKSLRPLSMPYKPSPLGSPDRVPTCCHRRRRIAGSANSSKSGRRSENNPFRSRVCLGLSTDGISERPLLTPSSFSASLGDSTRTVLAPARSERPSADPTRFERPFVDPIRPFLHPQQPPTPRTRSVTTPARSSAAALADEKDWAGVESFAPPAQGSPSFAAPDRRPSLRRLRDRSTLESKVPSRSYPRMTETCTALKTYRPRAASDPDDLPASSAARYPVQSSTAAAKYRVRLQQLIQTSPPCCGGPLASFDRSCPSGSLSRYLGRGAGVVRSARRASLSTDVDSRHHRLCLRCRRSSSCLARFFVPCEIASRILPTGAASEPFVACRAHLYRQHLLHPIPIGLARRPAARPSPKAPRFEVGLVEFPIVPPPRCLPCPPSERRYTCRSRRQQRPFKLLGRTKPQTASPSAGRRRRLSLPSRRTLYAETH